MTCQDFKRIIVSAGYEFETASERDAMAEHVRQCERCMTELLEKLMRLEGKVTPEQLEQARRNMAIRLGE